ncbi:MAG: cache domain-containing protein [Colwellia sp.]|nr:cache domain-containing protein [Colwellia sp.]
MNFPHLFKHRLSITGFVMLVIALLMILFSFYLVLSKYGRFNDDMAQLRITSIEKKKLLLQKEISKAVDFIKYKKNRTRLRLKNDLRANVELAHKIISSLYQRYHNTHSKNQIINMIKAALQDVRFFDGRGYVFINSMNDTAIFHPIYPESTVNSFLKEMTDVNGTKVADVFKEVIKEQGEGFVNYPYSRNIKNKERSSKLGYIKLFQPLDFYIGVAERISDYENNINQEIFERLSKVRFGKDGYIFIDNYGGVILMHPMKPEIVNKNLMDYEDINGTRVINKLIDAAKTPDGDFVYYTWNRPNEINNEINKVSFAMGIDSLKWMVGGGLYFDDIAEDISQEKSRFQAIMKTEIIKMLLILSTLFTIVFIIIKWWINSTKKSIDQMIDFFVEASEKNVYLDESKIYFQELNILAKNINAMIKSRKDSQEALEKANVMLHEQANRDFLTNLYNRRYFISASSDSLALIKRQNAKLSLLMIDIDDFKNINDTYGHDVGDTVIKSVAQKLLEGSRTSDIVARIGGEEFTILLPDTDAPGAILLAENIKNSLSSHLISAQSFDIPVTISIGIDTYSENKTIDNLISNADKALYVAKNSGKNRFMHFNKLS